MDSALEGTKVLDLGHYVAGPWCARMLADLGADVIKVERPGSGDPLRRYGPFPDDVPDPEKSGLFLFLNLNKRGITLNLKSAEGKAILLKLVEWADVVIENFEPRVLPSLGLSYTELREINPHIVLTSISNFGQFGPYSSYKATDIILYAMGVIMNIGGAHGREPLAHALEQAQKISGRWAATATLAALFQSEGEHVDLSIQEAINYGLAGTMNLYTYTGAITTRGPKDEYKRFFSPAGRGIPDLFSARDGFVSFGLPQGPREGALEILADLLEMPELKDPKYAIANKETEAQVEEMIFARTLELEKLPLFRKGMGREVMRGEGVGRRTVMSMVQTPDELLQSEQLLERDYFVTLDHPAAGRLTYPGRWFTMSETPIEITRPAPLLGQHNEEVFGELLGYRREDLVQLGHAGVI